MWLQKIINKRLIKRAIGSEYIYRIEAEEKSDFIVEESQKYSWIKGFFRDWVKEMKKEINKKYE